MGKSVFATKISLALGLILALIFGSAPVGAFAAVIRTTYIVQVQDGFANEVRGSIARLGEYPHDELTEVMDGFVIDLTDVEAEALRLAPYVKQVVADAPMSLMDTQSPTPSWGLDRIDQISTTGDNTYNFPASAGQGVRAYVVDTGVMASNPDFAGRMLPGVDMYGQNLENADCQGHGTHVAGTIAGTKYGVAKKVSIVPVRVLSCTGNGSWSYFISAMDWIIANNPVGTPAVMSASIGSTSRYPLAEAAVEKLYAAGITPVIAAGNFNVDACTNSPGAAPHAITVGATDATDSRASFSNWGECVDVFAPGVNIVSDSNVDPSLGVSKSGTSMATPHVSGLVALYLSANPTATPDQVTEAIRAGGLAGAVANAQTTLGNILVNNNFTRASLPVAPAPVYPPTAVTASAVTSSSATISWTAPVADAAVASTAPESYLIEYKTAADTTWQSVTSTSTSASISGLTFNTAYVVRVTSVAGSQSSQPTAEIQFSTLAIAPDAPSNLVSTIQYGNQIDLSWTKPASSNGSVVTGYYVEKLVGSVWTQVINTGVTVAAVKNLTPVTSYSFRVRAYSAVGTSEYSNVLTVSTTTATPIIPTALTFSNITGTTATVSWRAVPQIDAAIPITYNINLISRQTSNWGQVIAVFNSATNSVNLTGLKRSTSYYVSVVALSGAAASPASAQYLFTTTATKPGAPAAKAVKTVAGYDLAWTYPTDDGGSAVTGYQVEKANADGTWTVLATLGLVATYSIPAPARATSETYRVAAINALGVGAYSNVTVTTAPSVPAAPTALTLTRGTSNSVLTWVTPADNGGSAITFYAVYRSADNGLTWNALSSILISNTYTVSLPPKGVKYLYSVAARNVTGFGDKSNSVSDVTLATAPSAVRSIAFSYPVPGKLQISWGTPLDLGGSPITAYRLERQLADGSWSTLTEGNVLSFQIDRDLPGVLVTVRVTAINAIGSSPLLGATWRTPFVQATAPQNFAAVDNGSTVATSWLAPADLGGSTVSNYYVQISRDNGTTWSNLVGLLGNTTSYNVARPTKGTSWMYRVVAYTGFGYSLPSSTVTIAAAKTVPGVPATRSLVFAANGSMVYTWALSADNGGSVITAVTVETSTDNVTWTAVDGVTVTATNVTLARALPGVRVYFRVKASNESGTSAYSAVASIFTPYLKASAPQNLVATDNGSVVNLAWQAPSSLGGSAVSQYGIQVSRDGGTTWVAMAYVAGSVVSANVSRPLKGTTWSYRVFANTAFGASEISNSVTVAAAQTAPSAPRLTAFTLVANTTINLAWAAPTDNGGSPISGYVVETSTNNSTWTALPATTATTASIPAGAPGVRVYVRVSALNSIGSSVASSVLSAMTPYQVTSAPAGLAAVAGTTGRVQLSWSVPTSLGGANVSQYIVEVSNNAGATWSILGYSSATSVSVPAPAKALSYSWRVTARNAAGLSPVSAPVSYTSPQTSTSNVILLSALTSGAGKFTLTFKAPSDLGGYASYNYRIEVYRNGVWSQIAAGVGAANNSVLLTTPTTTAIYTYRVITTNPSGDSGAASFNYRG